MGGVDGAAAVTLLVVGVHQISMHSVRNRRWVFIDAVNHEIRHLSQEYIPWRHQTDGAATKFKTKFETEVNLNIGLKPDFTVHIKHWIKTEV